MEQQTHLYVPRILTELTINQTPWNMERTEDMPTRKNTNLVGKRSKKSKILVITRSIGKVLESDNPGFKSCLCLVIQQMTQFNSIGFGFLFGKMSS